MISLALRRPREVLSNQRRDTVLPIPIKVCDDYLRTVEIYTLRSINDVLFRENSAVAGEWDEANIVL